MLYNNTIFCIFLNTLIKVNKRLGGMWLMSRYSTLDRQQIFCASVGKNQWGPYKYGYHSPSNTQQYNAMLCTVYTMVQGHVHSSNSHCFPSQHWIKHQNCKLTLDFIHKRITENPCYMYCGIVFDLNETKWFDPNPWACFPFRSCFSNSLNYMCKTILTLASICE